MICCILVYVVILNCVYVRSLSLNKYILKYEMTNVQLSASNVEYLHGSSSLNSRPRLRVKFRFLDKEFDFVVVRSVEPFEPVIKILGVRKEKVRKRFAFYEKQPACELCLGAMGYVVEGTFTGFVAVNNTSFYVEPAYYYFQNMTGSTDVVIYRDVDVIYPPTLDSQRSAVVLGEKWHVRGPLKIARRKALTISKRSEAVCDIEVVGDDTVFHLLNGDIHHTAGFLYLHGKAADSVFRRSDLGPKIIRIINKNIEIFSDGSSRTYPFKTSTRKAKEFLELYSYRVQNYCVSMCICNRDFADDVIGLTYKADPTGQEVGGICQAPISLSHLGKLQSHNTGLITTKGSDGNRLPLAITLRAFTHELGHAFGSDHDPMDNLMCAPGGKSGYYLMYSKAQKSSTPLSNTFSPCSLCQMEYIISVRTCLHPIEADCGNGVREGEEECDCGDESTCLDVDPCCTPKGGINSDRGCTFMREKGHICSPKENPCCTENCELVPSSERLQCMLEEDNCATSYCNGEDINCPPPESSPDGTPCAGTSKTCSGGVCNSTVCKDQNMEDCTCAKFSTPCYVCCKPENGVCTPASELGFRTADGKDFFLKIGTSCGDGGRQCDADGECLLPDVRNFSSDQRYILYIMIGYIMIPIALFFLFIICLIFIFRDRISGLLARHRQTLAPPPQPYVVGAPAENYPETSAPVTARAVVPILGQVRF